MKFAKSFLTGSGALVLAGLILTLLVPRAAHAIAAMVQVVNTSADPVPTQSILPGKPTRSGRIYLRRPVRKRDAV
jgi:hypothetical protein